MSEEPVDLNVLSYRVERLEDRVDIFMEKVSSKLDMIIDKQNLAITQQALDRSLIKSIEREQGNISSRVDTLEENVVHVRISLAEKMVYGGVGGGAISLLVGLIQYLVNHSGG